MTGEIKLLFSFYWYKRIKKSRLLEKSYKSLLAHENKNLLQRCTL